MKKNLAIVFLAVCLCVAVVVSFNSVNTKKTEIDKLLQSVTQLQRDFDASNAQIAVLEGEKAALQADVETAKAALEAANAQIAVLEGEKTALQTDVDTAKAAAEAANAQIAALESEKTALQADVDAEKAAVEAANAQIAVLEGEKAALLAELDAIVSPPILTIERATFSVSNGMLQYSFVVYNADEETAVENPQFLVWIYNGDGDVIHEEILTLDTIEPGQRVVYESEVVEMAHATGGALEQILPVK